MIFLEWFCFGGALVSAWLYIRPDISGPLAGAIASAAFIAYGIAAEIPSAALTNVVFFIVHLRNLDKRRAK